MTGDLQNEPEDIPRMVEAVEAGNDVASGRRRRARIGGSFRPSHLINACSAASPALRFSDFGAPSTPTVGRRRADARSIGKQKFTKALVLSGGAMSIEVDVGMPRATDRPATHLFADAARTPRHGGYCRNPSSGSRAPGSVSSLSLRAWCLRIVFWIGESTSGPLFGGVGNPVRPRHPGLHLALIGEYLGRIQRDVEGRRSTRSIANFSRRKLRFRAGLSTPLRGERARPSRALQFGLPLAIDVNTRGWRRCASPPP